MDQVQVRHVVGRYPVRGVLRSENIEASVTGSGAHVRIRLDDCDHPDFWLEVTVELVPPSAGDPAAAPPRGASR